MTGFTGSIDSHGRPVHRVQRGAAVNDLADLFGPQGLNFAGLSPPVQIALLLGLTVLLPALVVTATSFTRCVIVLAFVRQALATPNVPPNLVLTGLSLFLTFYIMQPVFHEIDQKALQPYMQQQIPGQEALRQGLEIYKRFLLRHTRKSDLSLFLHFAGLSENPQLQKPEDTPFFVVLPAFVISELKTAFLMGFCIYLPFLMVDLVVASVLTSMGMVMMPPVTISAPFKVLLFVLADGWHLISYALTASFGST
jgi:flagellar biosynthetic protein FliP